MQPVHELWQFLTLKVGGPHTGIQGVNTEVHRIGTIGDGSLQRLPGAGGREQFRQDSGHGRFKRWAGSNTCKAWVVPS